jgi:hypothetical protein
MSDVAKLAAVFRAAANGVVGAYMHPADEAVDPDPGRVREKLTMQRISREFPAIGAAYFAYDGIASLFEALVEVERPASKPEGDAAEPETLAYLVVAENYRWPTTNEGAARRQLAIVPQAKLIELIERPGA